MSQTDETISSLPAGGRQSATAPPRGINSTAWQEIEAAVRRAEPRVLFVEPRILRRVILQDCRLSGIGFTVPHGQVYTIERERLLVIADRQELNVSPAADLPHQIILLPYLSEDRSFSDAERRFQLWKFWREVFHGRVHAELSERLQHEELTSDQIYDRIQQLGASEFFEVRQVLHRDELLQHHRDRDSAWVEFVAVALELRYFAPGERPYYFPAIKDWEAVDAWLDADLPHAAWHAETRPEGAPESCPEVSHIERPPVPAVDRTTEGSVAAGRQSQQWLQQAERAGLLGNQVQGVLLSHRAGDAAGAEVQLQLLSERLARLCGGPADEWQSALRPLLGRASSGYRTAEAKLLYDLQKACIAKERGVYRFGLWKWISSGGKQPLRRPLTVLEEVLVAKNIRTAVHRLPNARLHPEDRQRLTELLHQAEAHTEAILRERIRPLMTADLDAVGFVPTNIPEQVARDKLVEELLDHIAERGFLTMSVLRDAISQNQLKLADLGGLGELLRGDKLLRADKRLARSLEGVYRGGAIYLRAPQRLSSIAFGTPTGRFLVQYLVLPFGGAYVLLEALKHILAAMGLIGHGPAGELARKAPQAVAESLMARTASVEPIPASRHSEWIETTLSLLGGFRLFHLAVFVCGLFLLLLYHRPAFRKHVVTALKTTWKGARWLLVQLPLRIIRAPWVRWVLESAAYAVVRAYVFRPAVATAVVLTPLLFLYPAWLTPRLALEVFLGLNLFLNSPAGRYLEERVFDVVVRTWHELRFRFLAVAFQWIMDAFQRLMQGLEQVLYQVDEWLRFQAGDQGRFVALKLVVGLLWGVVAYVIQFAVTLLIEPQVNPIKHFPVVTVSHKILLPYTLWLKSQVQQVLGPGHEAWSATIATTIILLVPGMIGFLVWELKENWRLYKTNRPERLGATRIGHHGETLARLLRPGFHSGTLPKKFARLRHSLHTDPEDAHNLSSYRYLAEIEEIGVSIRRFVDREFCRLLMLTGLDGDDRPRVGCVRLATQKVELTIESLRPEADPATLIFEDRGGLVCAELTERGWLRELPPAAQRRVLTALTGLFHLGGVELLSAELRQRLPPGALWECTRELLLVSERAERRARYRLEEPDSVWLIPRDSEGRRLPYWPSLPADVVLLTQQSIRWNDWVSTWRNHETSEAQPPAPATVSC